MNNPVRLILKKVKTDSNGQLIDAGYRTIDIDNEQLESLIFEPNPHLRGKYQVVGAELLNEGNLYEQYKERLKDF